MRILLVFLLIVGLTLALHPAQPKALKDKIIRIKDGRRVIPCDETCTNGGDVATCCRAHGFGDGDCDGSDHAICF